LKADYLISDFRLQILDLKSEISNLKSSQTYLKFTGPVILNLFQDLTHWTNRDAESREARDMTPMGFKMLEINSQNLLRKNLKYPWRP